MAAFGLSRCPMCWFSVARTMFCDPREQGAYDEGRGKRNMVEKFVKKIVPNSLKSRYSPGLAIARY